MAIRQGVSDYSGKIAKWATTRDSRLSRVIADRAHV